jgi:hypothetical protein
MEFGPNCTWAVEPRPEPVTVMKPALSTMTVVICWAWVAVARLRKARIPAHPPRPRSLVFMDTSRGKEELLRWAQ